MKWYEKASLIVATGLMTSCGSLKQMREAPDVPKNKGSVRTEVRLPDVGDYVVLAEEVRAAHDESEEKIFAKAAKIADEEKRYYPISPSQDKVYQTLHAEKNRAQSELEDIIEEAETVDLYWDIRNRSAVAFRLIWQGGDIWPLGNDWQNFKKDPLGEWFGRNGRGGHPQNVQVGDVLTLYDVTQYINALPPKDKIAGRISDAEGRKIAVEMAVIIDETDAEIAKYRQKQAEKWERWREKRFKGQRPNTNWGTNWNQREWNAYIREAHEVDVLYSHNFHGAALRYVNDRLWELGKNPRDFDREIEAQQELLGFIDLMMDEREGYINATNTYHYNKVKNKTFKQGNWVKPVWDAPKLPDLRQGGLHQNLKEKGSLFHGSRHDWIKDGIIGKPATRLVEIRESSKDILETLHTQTSATTSLAVTKAILEHRLAQKEIVKGYIGEAVGDALKINAIVTGPGNA